VTLRSRVQIAASLLLAVSTTGAPAQASEINIEIYEPTPKAMLPVSASSVEVVGGASIYGGVKALDLFLVMDTSESLRRTDEEDYRTAGVVALVRSLHPKANIHLGVVDFDRKAQLLTGLTPDRDAVVAALQTLDQKGETNIAEGIRTALAGFAERGRPRASRVILLFTDGKSDEEAALAAMAEAQASGVAIHTLLLGQEQEGEALLRSIASGTAASFIAVNDPARLVDAFLNLRTTGVEHVMLRVDGAAPIPTQLTGGSFRGHVPLRPGVNRIEAIATSLSGSTASSSVTVVVPGTLRVSIATPQQGAELEPPDDEALVQGTASTWDESFQGPAPPEADQGVREVWLRVNDSELYPTRIIGGRFEGRIPLSDGENRVVALATSVDGRTAEDVVTVTVRAPGCAELQVSALRGDQPAISISDRAIELVFDASNSMWGRMQGEPKISVAKRILADALGWLPGDLALSLRVYGHQTAHSARNCRDSELLVPLGTGSRERIRAAIGSFKPRGQTPLAYSLEQIAADFGDFRGERAVVLVTDGIESCGGDPASAARALQASGPTPVHVIGFGLAAGEDEDNAALRAIARASGGKFLTARSAEELREALSVTVGTPFAVRRGARTVAEGTLGSEAPIRLPQGEYTLRIESAPPYEVPLSLASEQGLRLLLKRDGRKVFHARRTQPIEYARCEIAESPKPSEDGVVWEELPDAAPTPASQER
jgi:Mg-chelatase subunit ChlD